MLRFKQFLLEGKVKIVPSTRGMMPFPVSINARNVTSAKQEIADAVTDKISFVDPDNEDIKDNLKELRGVYNIKNGNMYTWFALDAAHETIQDFFKIKFADSVHLVLFTNVVIASSRRDGPIENLHKHKKEDIKKWKTDIVKYIGKSTKFMFEN